MKGKVAKWSRMVALVLISLWLLLMACGPFTLGVYAIPLPEGEAARVFCVLGHCWALGGGGR